MEDGSLLPNALRSMQKLRENEQNLNFPFHHFFEPQQKDENNRPLDSNLHLGTRNALVISLYCIDSGADVNLGLDADAPLHRKQLLRKLASIHNLIHTKIIPVYNKRYKHNWFTGGEGICFGLHCQDVHSTDDHDQSRTVPGPLPNHLDPGKEVVKKILPTNDCTVSQKQRRLPKTRKEASAISLEFFILLNSS